MTMRRTEPERFNMAVRAGCQAADLHLTCTFPQCRCRNTPRIVQSAIDSWEAADGETGPTNLQPIPEQCQWNPDRWHEQVTALRAEIERLKAIMSTCPICTANLKAWDAADG